MARHTTMTVIRHGLASVALIVCLFASLQDVSAQSAPERIISFLSDITVEADGRLLVKETSTVPTIRRGPLGLIVKRPI